MPKKIKGLVKEVWESKIKQKPSKNKHISYSSISTYNKCPKLWELQYLRHAVPFRQNIYTCFGSAMHETMQEWLEVLYHDKVKTADEMDLDKLLYNKMVQQYKQGKAINGHQHFSSVEQLNEFWLDGKHILKYLKSKRAGYFSTKTMMLAGIETLLYQEIKVNVEFFIVKRRVPAEADFASMQRRVQQFSPTSGPRKTKEVLALMDTFIKDVVGPDGKYLDKEYHCKSPLGKCRNCSEYI